MATGVVLVIVLVAFGLAAIERWRRRTVYELEIAEQRDARRRRAWDELGKLDRAA